MLQGWCVMNSKELTQKLRDIFPVVFLADVQDARRKHQLHWMKPPCYKDMLRDVTLLKL